MKDLPNLWRTRIVWKELLQRSLPDSRKIKAACLDLLNSTCSRIWWSLRWIHTMSTRLFKLSSQLLQRRRPTQQASTSWLVTVIVLLSSRAESQGLLTTMWKNRLLLQCALLKTKTWLHWAQCLRRIFLIRTLERWMSSSITSRTATSSVSLELGLRMLEIWSSWWLLELKSITAL